MYHMTSRSWGQALVQVLQPKHLTTSGYNRQKLRAVWFKAVQFVQSPGRREEGYLRQKHVRFDHLLAGEVESELGVAPRPVDGRARAAESGSASASTNHAVTAVFHRRQDGESFRYLVASSHYVDVNHRLSSHRSILRTPCYGLYFLTDSTIARIFSGLASSMELPLVRMKPPPLPQTLMSFRQYSSTSWGDPDLKQRGRDVAHDARVVLQDFLCLEHVGEVEVRHHLTFGQFEEILQPVPVGAFAERHRHVAQLDRSHHRLLQARPVEFLELFL